MVTTITRGTASITPRLILGYESTRAGQHVLHDLYSTASPTVSFRTPSTRTGMLEHLFLTEAESKDAEAFYTYGLGIYVLSDSDRPSIAMKFVPGDVTRVLDPETRTRWILRVSYREVY